MKGLSLAIVFCTVSAAVAKADAPRPAPGAPLRQANQAHPAVVRIITPQRDGMAFGSGTLVATNPTQGLIVTNWHVVQDPVGPITVLFPDGFCSNAAILRADRDWDLAALAICRPHVEPVPIAERAPRPGDPLMIAGYGSGAYRAVAGRCTQYVAPSPRHRYEMVELTATARQGDSGGPIFNGRGELAGVLFGTGGGSTTGSYCGRVRAFLSPILGDPSPARTDPNLIARRPSSAPHLLDSDGAAARVASDNHRAGPSLAQPPPAASVEATWGAADVVPMLSLPATPPSSAAPTPPVAAIPAASDTVRPSTGNRVAPPAPAALPTGWELIGGTTPFEQFKSLLAVVGVFALLYCVLRLLTRAEQSQARQTECQGGPRRTRREKARLSSSW